MLGGRETGLREDASEGAAVLGGVDRLGGVPTTGTPLSLSAWARPSGVWPPSWTMTPAIGPASDSAWTISSTSSSVSGSKYRRSEVS